MHEVFGLYLVYMSARSIDGISDTDVQAQTIDRVSYMTEAIKAMLR